MSELVVIQDNQAVTDSLTVSEVFDKEHKHVLRDIKLLGCSEEFRQSNFGQSSYINSQNKDMPMYYMNKKGFTLLVMGYTGPKAMKFKEEYINEFERMEKQINEPKALSPTEQLKASMRLSLETSEELSEVKTKVSSLEERFDNELTLNHGQATALNHAVKKRIEKLWNEGVKGTLESKHQMYAHIYSQMKRAFQAPTYREVKRKDFDESIQWVSAWRPL